MHHIPKSRGFRDEMFRHFFGMNPDSFLGVLDRIGVIKEFHVFYMHAVLICRSLICRRFHQERNY